MYKLSSGRAMSTVVTPGLEKGTSAMCDLVGLTPSEAAMLITKSAMSDTNGYSRSETSSRNTTSTKPACECMRTGEHYGRCRATAQSTGADVVAVDSLVLCVGVVVVVLVDSSHGTSAVTGSSASRMRLYCAHFNKHAHACR